MKTETTVKVTTTNGGSVKPCTNRDRTAPADARWTREQIEASRRSFGAWVRAQRLSRGLTHTMVGEALGVPVEYIEAGTRVLTANMVDGLQNMFGPYDGDPILGYVGFGLYGKNDHVDADSHHRARVERLRRDAAHRRVAGPRLRDARAKSGMSTVEFAARIGRYATDITHWESGGRIMPVPDCIAAAAILGVPALWLAGLENERTAAATPQADAQPVSTPAVVGATPTTASVELPPWVAAAVAANAADCDVCAIPARQPSAWLAAAVAANASACPVCALVHAKSSGGVR